MMRKIILSSILIISMLFCSSCSMLGSRIEMLNKSNDDENADTRLEQVLETIKNQDKDALRALFSKQALDEVDDFDAEADSLFTFIQEGTITWESTDSLTVHETNDYGHKTKEVSSYYYVNTDKQKYYFLLEDNPVDTDHPNNVGLYMLLVVKADDRLKVYDQDQKILYNGDQEITHAGVYIPLK